MCYRERIDVLQGKNRCATGKECATTSIYIVHFSLYLLKYLFRYIYIYIPYIRTFAHIPSGLSVGSLGFDMVLVKTHHLSMY
jgi:hypothetical protein